MGRSEDGRPILSTHLVPRRIFFILHARKFLTAHRNRNNSSYMRCRCGYEWKARVANPKACPECKRRLGKRALPAFEHNPLPVRMKVAVEPFVAKLIEKQPTTPEEMKVFLLEKQKQIDARRAAEAQKEFEKALPEKKYKVEPAERLGIKSDLRGL